MADQVTARDAIKIVQDYYQFATGNFGMRMNLEEIERAIGTSNWLVTMSFEDGTSSYVSGSTILRYKIFEVDSKNGEVVSMKNPPSF